MPGLNFDLTNLPTGVTTGTNLKYTALYPQVQGRALHHDEMDYNLNLVGHVINGYRVIGSADGGEIDTTVDMDKVLKLHTVDANDLATLPNAFSGTNVGDIVWIMATGASGTAGADGADGADGTDGTDGTSGTSGTSGLAGQHGTSGVSGTDGTSGVDGAAGTDGTDGTSGTTGTSGTSGSSGTSGLPCYTSLDGASDTTTATVGELPAGSGPFNCEPWDDLMDSILFAYQEPGIFLNDVDPNAFNQPNILELGQHVGEPDRTQAAYNSTPATTPIQCDYHWSFSNGANIEPNTTEIMDVTSGNVTVISNTDHTDGIEPDPTGLDISKSTQTSHQWKIRAKKQENGVPLGTYINWNSFTIYWRPRIYWGVSTNATGAFTEAEIYGLLASAGGDSSLATGWGTGSYSTISGSCISGAISCWSFQPNGKYCYWAVPSGFPDIDTATNGNAIIVKDVSGGFQVPVQNAITGGGTVSFQNPYGITMQYSIYRTTNSLGAANVQFYLI